jgi:hypothetical protein
VLVYASWIPAIYNSFLVVGGATNPVPLGAGINLTLTDPPLPVTLHGTVCGNPIIFPQYPFLTGMRFNLACNTAPLMAPYTSLAHFHPNPI